MFKKYVRWWKSKCDWHFAHQWYYHFYHSFKWQNKLFCKASYCLNSIVRRFEPTNYVANFAKSSFLLTQFIKKLFVTKQFQTTSQNRVFSNTLPTHRHFARNHPNWKLFFCSAIIFLILFCFRVVVFFRNCRRSRFNLYVIIPVEL